MARLSSELAQERQERLALAQKLLKPTKPPRTASSQPKPPTVTPLSAPPVTANLLLPRKPTPHLVDHLKTVQTLTQSHIPPPHRRVFISYAWEGNAAMNSVLQSLLKILAKQLEQCGLTCFLDVQGMDGDMEATMRANLEAAECVVFVCTPRFKERAEQTPRTNLGFELETALALSRDKSRGRPKLLPIIVMGTFATSVPKALMGMLVRGFTDSDRWANLLVDLESPMGLLPSLLRLRDGASEEVVAGYKASLAKYRLKAAQLVPPVPREAIPRAALLEALQRALEREPRTGVAVLTGPAGSGKSLLAVAAVSAEPSPFAFRRVMDCSRGLQPAFAALAQDLGLDISGHSPSDVRSEVYERIGPSFVLVLDGLAGPGALTEDHGGDAADAAHEGGVWPTTAPPGPGSWQVIITSRDTGKGWGPVGAVPVPVGPMSESESARLLLGYDSSDPEELQTAGLLAQRLGRMPLELDQAARFMATRGVAAQAYLDELARVASQLSSSLTSSGGGSSSSSNPASTVLLSLEQLPADARMVTRWMSLLSPDRVPVSLFVHPELLGDEARASAAVREAVRMGLISPGGLPGTVAMTATVHRAAGLPDSATAAEWWDLAKPLVSLLARLCPDMDVRTHEGVLRLSELEPHMTAIADNPRIDGPYPELAEMLIDLSDGYLSIGRGGGPERQLALYERALRIQEAALGRTHRVVARTLRGIGVIKNNEMDEFDAARVVLEEALAILGSDEGADAAKTLVALASVHRGLGDKATQEALLLRALVSMEAANGPEHPTVARVLTALAGVFKVRDIPRATALAERAVEILSSYFGPVAAGLALVYPLHMLASIRRLAGDLATSRALLERVLSIEVTFLGANSEDAQDTRVDVAGAIVREMNSLPPDAARAMLEKERPFIKEAVGEAYALLLERNAEAFKRAGGRKALGISEELITCIEAGQCTFTVSDRGFPTQLYYRCLTCFETKALSLDEGVCEACRAKCHADHKVEPFPYFSKDYYCDCKCEK